MPERIVLAVQGILLHEELIVREEEALGRLRGVPGLALTPLLPPFRAIQVVAVDGQHLGRVRLEEARYRPERWLAVPRLPGKPCGPFRSPMQAAEQLARMAGVREDTEHGT